MSHPLCAVDELPETGCREFAVGEEKVFAVQHSGILRVYLNRCPHAGTRLNWQPGKFLDYEKKYIQCKTHDALFEIDSGRCISGPCYGESLHLMPHRVEKGVLYLDT